jgi:nickel transport protein
VLFAYVEGSTVFTQSSFSNGKRCQNSKIEVFDMFGNKLLEGKTDGNGAFSFTPPERTDLRIVLTASMGHRDEYVIRAGELPDGRERKISQHETHAAEKRAFPAEKGEEQKKPLMRLLENRRTEGISFVRLMGGIGFIFGLMGIAVYVRKRRAR